MIVAWKLGASPDGRQAAAAGRRNAVAAVEVLTVRLDVGPAAVSALTLLSAEERRRAGRFSRVGDGRRFAAGRARLRQLLGARLGVPPAGVELESGEHGKPVLSGRFAEARLHFSVAHAGEVAVYAFAAGREVGVDIEAVRAFDEADAIVRQFFSPREQADYQALAPRDRPLGFFNGWTRKEAFAKALGLGLYQHLASFDVSLTPGEPARIVRVGATAGEDCGWVLQDFIPAPGLVGALVVRADGSH